jgi:DNA (cytosine-5)-methyltransferase 1
MRTSNSASARSGRNGAKCANNISHNSKANSGNAKSAVGRNYISLFSGGMGLDIGLERAGFNCVVANEIDALAVETIRLNKPTLPVISASVEEVTLKTLSKAAGFDVSGIDLLAGGPPCQAFSVFGQRRGLHDGRGRMIFEFFRLVNEVKPKAFLMENVRGLHSMPLMPKGVELEGKAVPLEQTEPGSLLRELIRQFESIGYRIDCYLVNSVNYGAPQIRERLLCIGSQFDLDPAFPPPEYSNRPSDKLPPFRTLGDVIGAGFDDPDPSMMNFSPRKLKYLAMVPPGGNWRNLPEDVQKESMGKSWYLKGGRSAYWRKLAFEFPCPTVVTMPNHAGTSMCHPTELRALTVGEMAAVQEFPRDWTFVGSTTDKCRQIGNAVPPRLGEVAGRVVQQLLKTSETTTPMKGKPKISGRIIHVRPHVRTRSYFKGGEVIDGHTGYYDRKSSSDDQMLLTLDPVELV